MPLKASAFSVLCGNDGMDEGVENLKIAKKNVKTAVE